MGLNESYNVMKGSILMKSPLPTVGQVYSLLLQEETQRKIHSTSHLMADSAFLNANSFRYSTSGQYGGNGNFQKKVGTDIKKIHCNYCKKPGHTRDKCFKLHGFPADFKFTKPKRVVAQAEISDQSTNVVGNSSSPSQSVGTSFGNSPAGFTPEICSQLMNLLKSAQSSESAGSSVNFAGNLSVLPSFACFSDSNHASWILDSGASDHMCFIKSLFTSMTPLSQPLHISLPNGQLVTILHSGTVPLINDIILTNVLYVPLFKYNLLSINKLTQQLNCTAHFTHNMCYL